MLDVSPEKIHFSNMISHSVGHVINGTSSNTKIMSGYPHMLKGTLQELGLLSFVGD